MKVESFLKKKFKFFLKNQNFDHFIEPRSYLSYAVAKIRSYNPIENVEYSTIREQGFMVYLPLNNEIILNLAEKSMT